MELVDAMRRTLQEKILALPDHVQVYPTHVAGSLCGSAIGSQYSTTIGYERRLNRLLACLTTKQEFVTECLNLDSLPTVPPYWRRMRGLNQQGPPLLGVLAEPPPLLVRAFAHLIDDGAVVLDCRSPEAYGGGHIPRALNVGFGPNFPTWAGSVLPVGVPLLLVLEQPSELWEVCWSLLRIGYELARGWLGGGMQAWRTSGNPIATLAQWTVQEFRQRIVRERDLVILDVRQSSEWVSAHIDGARHIPGGEIVERAAEIPRDRPVAVICSSGYRSSVGASVLAQRGHARIANVLGGMTAWTRAGLPTTKGK
jgi:hydroxyacylglutathione hydrolase